MSNILPKKLWHVGRPENIEKVRTDENKVKVLEERLREEEEKDWREARLRLLQSKAGHQPARDADRPDEDKVAEAQARASPKLEKIKGLETRMCMSKDLSRTPWYSGAQVACKDDAVYKSRLDPCPASSASYAAPAPPQRPRSVEEMRLARLERERSERIKADALLAAQGAYKK